MLETALKTKNVEKMHSAIEMKPDYNTILTLMTELNKGREEYQGELLLAVRYAYHLGNIHFVRLIIFST